MTKSIPVSATKAVQELRWTLLLVDLATQFALAEGEVLEHVIREGLDRIAQTLNVDRVLLLQQEWQRPSGCNVKPDEPLCFKRVDDIPGASNREALLRHGLRSGAVVPVPVPAAAGHSYGLVLGSNCETCESHGAIAVAQLRLLSAVVGQALARAIESNPVRPAFSGHWGVREELVRRPKVKISATSNRLVSKCPSMQHVFEHVESVASLSSTVLLLGETGVGKEVLAEEIHARSPRREHEMIRVNCAAIPSALIEASCSGANAARTPAPSRAKSADSRLPTIRHCSSTRLESCRRKFR